MSCFGSSPPPVNHGDLSKTPEHAPSSTKLSPPPLKQYRLPRHIAPPSNHNAKYDGELNSSSLISVLHGHDLTPRSDSSVASNLESFFTAPDAEDSRDSNPNDAVKENLADYEVAMLASYSKGVSNHRDAALVDSSSATSRPFFPRQTEFVASPTVRGRFTLRPKIKLFEARNY